MVVRPDGTHVLPVQNKICQNHFFKIQFSFAEKLERADVFLILWDSCEKNSKNLIVLICKILCLLLYYIFDNIINGGRELWNRIVKAETIFRD